MRANRGGVWRLSISSVWVHDFTLRFLFIAALLAVFLVATPCLSVCLNRSRGPLNTRKENVFS